jgi:hypothetical protein
MLKKVPVIIWLSHYLARSSWAMHKLAKFITYLFFPGTMAILGFVLLQESCSVLPHFLLLALLPVTSLFYLKHLGVIADLNIFNRAERAIPLLITIAFAGADLVILAEYGWLQAWQWTYLGVSVLALIVTLSGIKISLHGLGVGSFFALAALNLAFLHDFFWFAVATLLIAAVYWARRKLQAHSHFELILGVSCAFVLTFVMFYIHGL